MEWNVLRVGGADRKSVRNREREREGKGEEMV